MLSNGMEMPYSDTEFMNLMTFLDVNSTTANNDPSKQFQQRTPKIEPNQSPTPNNNINNNNMNNSGFTPQYFSQTSYSPFGPPSSTPQLPLQTPSSNFVMSPHLQQTQTPHSPLQTPQYNMGNMNNPLSASLSPLTSPSPSPMGTPINSGPFSPPAQQSQPLHRGPLSPPTQSGINSQPHPNLAGSIQPSLTSNPGQTQANSSPSQSSAGQAFPGMGQTPSFDISSANPDSPDQLLNQLYQMAQKQKEHLEKMRQYQKTVMMRPQKDAYDVLVAQQQQLKTQITDELKALSQLFQTVILPPADIHKLLFLVQEIQIQKTQLELFQKELHQLAINPQISVPACALLVTEQPLPMVITKNKQLEDDPIVVQLLTGANVDIQTLSKVKVAMVCENHQVKSNSRKSIENDTQNMDPYRRTAKFYLKFLTGTRKNPVNLRFGIQIQLSNQRITVESDSTKPFIVITNECQWEESEGVLLKQDAFSDQLEVLWPQFANILQRHFIRATRQELTRPTRCLSPFDLEYLHQQFFGGQRSISQKAYDNFWMWFGKGIQKLRYQRHICPLWQSGLIFGFLTRDGVVQALLDEEVGTFLVRFSERHPGLFAVGYKTCEDSDPHKAVRHYLIRPEDTAGAKKTLPDFLRSSQAFQQLLQVTGETENGRAKTRKFPRDVVLAPYYSKRDSFKGALGYEDELPNQQFL